MVLFLSSLAKPCRLILHQTGLSVCPFRLCRVLWGGIALAACVPVGCCISCVLLLPAAMAMPLPSQTAGELRRAQARQARGPLPAGRPVTHATNLARERYWSLFESWATGNGLDLSAMLSNSHWHVEDINCLLVRYGRELYSAGKSYNQYAETINALGTRRPAMRRMLQGAWDLGYSWVRSEPSVHHIAVPVPIILALTSTAMMWGWLRVAGCLALGFSAMLRPGEITGAYRRDLLLPKDSGYSVRYALLSVREPKSRFTYARHQTAKADSPDFLQIIEIAFQDLHDHERLWPFSPQTLRNRFKVLLGALDLPSVSRPGSRCLDLGSLRSGGATFAITATENTELVRRRGRWASPKMMDIYIQETMAIQYMKLIPSSSKAKVLEVAAVFDQVLYRCLQLYRDKIPLEVWFFLFSC